MKTISNSLTRWHKVSERLKLATAEIAASNLAAITIGHIDFDTLEVRKGTLKPAAERAITEQTALMLKLQSAMFEIRRVLAKANTAHGISDLLNDLEHAKQRMNYFCELVRCAEEALSEDEFQRLAEKRAKALCAQAESGSRFTRVLADGGRASITFLSAERLREMVAKREAFRVEMNALSDRLADANATKLSMALDDDVARHLGL
jgi:hypothetical protein